MNEQEAQKVSFKKWGDFNKNSLSIDHKNGHQQGWDDAIEWVKRGRDCPHKDESLALVLTVVGFIGLGLLIATGV